MGALCGEGLLAPLLKWAAHTGSEGHPVGPQPPNPETPPTNAPEKGSGGDWWGLAEGYQTAGRRGPGAGTPGAREATTQAAGATQSLSAVF